MNKAFARRHRYFAEPLESRTYLTFALGPEQSTEAGYFPGTVIAADLNGDGKADLVSRRQGNRNDDTPTSDLRVMLGHGDGTFDLPLMFVIYPGVKSPLVADDFTGDGKQDLVLWDERLDLFLVPGNGDGTIGSPVSLNIPLSYDFDNGADSPEIRSTDFNNDGKRDFYLSSTDGSDDPVMVYINNGDGTFTHTPFATPADRRPRDMHATDMNGDGNVDIVFSSDAALAANTLDLALGNGDGTFTAIRSIDLAIADEPALNSFRVGDLDGINGPDVVVFDGYREDGRIDHTLRTLLNNGDGTFAPGIVQRWGEEESDTFVRARLIDVDNDGKLDFIGYEGEDEQTLRVWIGNGDGTLMPIGTRASYARVRGNPLGDLNSDGRVDFGNDGRISTDRIFFFLNEPPSAFGGPPNTVDLVISNATAQRQAHLSEADVLMSARLTNRGTTTFTGTPIVDYYFSLDRQLDAGDMRFEMEFPERLDIAPGETVKAFPVEDMVFPDFTYGTFTYYLIVVVDPDNTIAESDETNNMFVSPTPFVVHLGAFDLTMSDFAMTANTPTLIAGTTNVTFVNRIVSDHDWPSFTGPYKVNYYLSADGRFDANDTLIVSMSTTDWSGDSLMTTTATLPTVYTGKYRVLAVLDPENEAIEAGKYAERNNILALPSLFAITGTTPPSDPDPEPTPIDRPDLTIESLGLSYRGNSAIGDLTTSRATIKVRNAGQLNHAGPTVVTLYASADGSFDAGEDTPFATAESRGAIKPGASKNIIANFTFPDVADGSYTIFASVTPATGESAVDDQSLAAAAPVVIAAPFVDLTPTATSATYRGDVAIGTVTKGKAKVTVVNGGNVAYRGPVTVNFYASTDGTLDGGDALVTSYVASSRTSLAAGKGKSFSTSFVFPDVADGQYVLLADVTPVTDEAVVDNQLAVSEGSAIIERPVVDLAGTFTSLPTTVALGKTARVTLKVTNDGNVPAKGPVTVTYFLSTDQTIGDDDLQFAPTTTQLNLSAGKSKSLRATSTFAADFPAGAYYVIAVIDPGTSFVDSVLANNTVFSETLIVVG